MTGSVIRSWPCTAGLSDKAAELFHLFTMTLPYLNADGTVLYEGNCTYADLADAVKPAA